MATRSGYPRRKEAKRRICRSCGYSYIEGHYRAHLRESAWHRARRKRR